MNANLESRLPEDQPEHGCAVAGDDALLLADDILREIQYKLDGHWGGFFQWWCDEEGESRQGDDDTLERVRELVLHLKAQRVAKGAKEGAVSSEQQ